MEAKIYLVEKEWKVRYNKTCVSHETDDKLRVVSSTKIVSDES